MTPKEKAEQIVGYFNKLGYNDTKEMSLIVANEAVEQWEYIDTYLSDLGGELNPNLKYWYEVVDILNTYKMESKSICPINDIIEIGKCIYRGGKCSVCIEKESTLKSKKPDWLETLYNVNPRLAERAEEYIKSLYSTQDMEQFAEWLLDNGYEKHPKFHRLYGKVYDSVLKLISQLREQWEIETGRRGK